MQVTPAFALGAIFVIDATATGKDDTAAGKPNLLILLNAVTVEQTREFLDDVPAGKPWCLSRLAINRRFHPHKVGGGVQFSPGIMQGLRVRRQEPLRESEATGPLQTGNCGR